jgi:hypothetical protein
MHAISGQLQMPILTVSFPLTAFFCPKKRGKWSVSFKKRSVPIGKTVLNVVKVVSSLSEAALQLNSITSAAFSYRVSVRFGKDDCCYKS